MNNHSSIYWKAFFFLFMTGCVVLGIVIWRQTPESVPEEAAISPSVTRTNTIIRTNTWYSNVYKQFSTEPFFALPGAYRFDANGLSIGFPDVVGTPNTVFGSFNAWCSFGMESSTTAVSVARSGDWDVVFEIHSGSLPWRVQLSQGSPVAQLSQFTSPLVVTCQSDVAVTPREDGLILKRGERSILIQGKGLVRSEQGGEKQEKWRLIASEQSYRVLLVPPVTTEPESFFAALPFTDTVETLATPKIQGDNLSVTYNINTKQQEPVLTTVWPHHVLSGSLFQILGEYPSVLGTLRLIQTSSFTTVTKAPILDTTFHAVSDTHRIETIREAVRQDVAYFQKDTPPAGVYFLGTWLGGVASAAQIADLYGMDQEREHLLDMLQNELVVSLKNFVYREDVNLFVAKNTEFGNDVGNDHHFHYGYYLRSAAVLVLLRPSIKKELEPIIDELAYDIATTDRGSTRYPYIRNFSPYEGHSWADAYAVFSDGNNQESTSEALNAWYGLTLWGRMTGNNSLEGTGRYLYTTELLATRAYWFGENNPFPTGYNHTIASLIWGGKRDYATWFSGQAMHIHGIQWLPITPASEYLGTLPFFSERKMEILRAHASPVSHEWGDLYVAVLSYTSPNEAVALLPEAAKHSAMKSTSLLYQTVYYNLEQKK